MVSMQAEAVARVGGDAQMCRHPHHSAPFPRTVPTAESGGRPGLGGAPEMPSGASTHLPWYLICCCCCFRYLLPSSTGTGGGMKGGLASRGCCTAVGSFFLASQPAQARRGRGRRQMMRGNRNRRPIHALNSTRRGGLASLLGPSLSLVSLAFDCALAPRPPPCTTQVWAAGTCEARMRSCFSMPACQPACLPPPATRPGPPPPS